VLTIFKPQCVDMWDIKVLVLVEKPNPLLLGNEI